MGIDGILDLRHFGLYFCRTQRGILISCSDLYDECHSAHVVAI